MSLAIEFTFQSPAIDQWELMFKGLANGETGALFQDRMNDFGLTAAELLEDILERWPTEYCLVSGYERKNDKFWVQFVGGPDAAAFAKAMGSLLTTCGVDQLTCEALDLSGD